MGGVFFRFVSFIYITLIRGVVVKAELGIDHRSHQHMVPEAFSNELAK